MSEVPPYSFLTHRVVPRAWIFFSATFLLVASWMPIVEIKGFDTFDISTVALWGGRIANVTLFSTILTLMMQGQLVARWFLALSVGVLCSPMIDLLARCMSLADMMNSGQSIDITSLIVPLWGAWALCFGMVCWFFDLLALCVRKFIKQARS